MKKADTAYITVGKIGSPFGVHGWLKVRSYTELDASILDFKPWYISRDEEDWQAIAVEDGREQGNGMLIKFEGINTPEAARQLTGNVIGIQRDQLPQLTQGEYYWSDLIGLTVVNMQGEALGKVSYMIATGANDVLVIKGEKEHAIPYLPGDVIKHVDLAKQEIQVDWELI